MVCFTEGKELWIEAEIAWVDGRTGPVFVLTVFLVTQRDWFSKMLVGDLIDSQKLISSREIPQLCGEKP